MGYWSRRLNRGDDARSAPFGNLMQSMEATPYRGKRVRYRAAVRIEPAGDDSRAQMWLRIDRPNRQMGFFDNMENRPIRSREWAVYEIAGEVDADAERINFGTILSGKGSAWVDSVSLEILEEGQTACPRRDRECRLRTGSTRSPLRLDGSGSDVQGRAAVVLAWNIFQHFYPYFDVVQTDWPQALRNALQQAATDTDEVAFLGTLRRLVGELRDGHGSVTLPGERVFKPPFAWRLVENRLVITHLLEGAPAGLEVGDIVSHVGGRPANEALAS